jgi:hypothetical protein
VAPRIVRGIHVGRQGLPGGRAAPPPAGVAGMITGLAHSRAKSTRECANSLIMGQICAPRASIKGKWSLVISKGGMIIALAQNPTRHVGKRAKPAIMGV